MSSFEFFPEERPLAIESEADALLPGDIDVPAFRGMGHEAWAAPARGMVRLGEAAGLAAGAINGPIDSLLGTDLQDQAFGSVDRMRAVRESMVLRPGEIGVAARVLGGLGEFVTQLAVARSPGALASTILGTSSDLAVAGVDPQTAVQAGTLEGAGLAVGLRIPTLGATLAQRAGLGAGANVAQGVITRGAVGELLRSEGAPAGVAEGYQAWDGEAVIVDALAGLVFGGIDHWAARPDVAALNDHVHRVARTAPGVPQTADALDAHTQALDTALGQVLADEPVTVQAPPDRFVDDGARARSVARTEFEVATLAPPADAPVDESQIVNAIDRGAIPSQKLRQLAKLTEVNKPIVDQFLEQLDAELGTESKSNIKKPATILSKVKRPELLSTKPWFDVEHIRDSFRFKTILTDVRDLPRVIEQLRGLGATVVKPDVDKVLKPKPWGFRISVFDLRMPNGQLVEYYLPVREIEEFKTGRGHQLFENWRDAKLSDLTPEQRVRYEADRAESAAGYQAAWEAYLRRTGATEDEVRASLDNALAIASSRTSSKVSSNSAEVRDGAPSVQAPAGERVAQNPESITTIVPSGDLNTGITAASADIVAEAPAALQGADGAAAVVVTERGLEVPVRYRVVDAAALITSHNDALEADPRFPPELQPRDRTRAASDQQIAKIENAIRPELLGESVKASDGAPIVGADGVVESGNARTIALRRAYARNKAGIYREWLRANAARFGLDPAAVDGMAAPVLVRVAQGARDRAEFARQANESAIAAMPPGELARADAQRLGSLEGLATNEDGSINLAQSRPVVDAYLRDVVSPADLNTTTTADGGLSQFGLARLRNAIFARAYGDTELLQALTESLDSNVKNVLAGMVRAAPEVARLRDLQAEGARHPIPVFDDFAQAVREFQAMRRDGISLAQREAQGGLFGDDLPAPVRNLIAGLEENSRAPKRMAELLSHMARTVDAAGDPRQGGLFGDVTAAPDAAEVSNAAVARIRREYEVKATADLFASPTMAAAIELAATRPDMTVINADGVEVPAAQALAEADAAIREAEALAPGVDALAACALQQLATVA